MKQIAGIVLAAGASSRMGQDKALLRWGKKTFLEHLLAALRNAETDPVRVVLGANADQVQKEISLGAGEAVLNPDWQKGMLSSLIAGINSLPADVEAAAVCLVDHPCVSSTLIRALRENFRTGDKLIAIPTYQGRRGHPVLFSATLFDELRAAPLEVGARHVVRRHADDILELPTEEEGVLLNTNDRAAYEKILSKQPPG
ncbi:MAG: NTP transferase domain-containing protein, partial [Candidatus Acidiferrales bacterium]